MVTHHVTLSQQKKKIKLASYVSLVKTNRRSSLSMNKVQCSWRRCDHGIIQRSIARHMKRSMMQGKSNALLCKCTVRHVHGHEYRQRSQFTFKTPSSEAKNDFSWSLVYPRYG